MRHKSNTESVVVVLLLRLTFSSVVKHKLFQDTYSAHVRLCWTSLFANSNNSIKLVWLIVS